MVLVRKADGKKLQKTTWTTQAKKEEILEQYRGWCPVIHALINHVPASGVLETPMNNMPPLPTWVKGQIALAGDACRRFPLAFVFIYLFGIPILRLFAAGAVRLTLDLDRLTPDILMSDFLRLYAALRRTRGSQCIRRRWDPSHGFHLHR